MKRLIILTVALLAPAMASANSEQVQLKTREWSFDGAFGTVDRAAAQRGFQVYKEVCAACHSLKRVSYRNLEALGFSEGEVKAIAAEHNVPDGPNDAGDMFERPARPSDKFASPYANDKAARASNGGALPPDLSLIIKARPNGANYVYSLLHGYDEPMPKDLKLGHGMNFNAYFPGMQIAMPKPLSADQVTYIDDTKPTLDQEAYDVVNFLQWAAEPEMEHRKEMGLKVIGFLVIATAFFYVAKRRVWARLK